MPEEHAKHSPSQLKNKKVCPQWTNDSSGDTRAADEGTMLHDVMEKWATAIKEGDFK